VCSGIALSCDSVAGDSLAGGSLARDGVVGDGVVGNRVAGMRDQEHIHGPDHHGTSVGAEPESRAPALPSKQRRAMPPAGSTQPTGISREP